MNSLAKQLSWYPNLSLINTQEKKYCFLVQSKGLSLEFKYENIVSIDHLRDFILGNI